MGQFKQMKIRQPLFGSLKINKVSKAMPSSLFKFKPSSCSNSANSSLKLGLSLMLAISVHIRQMNYVTLYTADIPFPWLVGPDSNTLSHSTPQEHLYT